MKEIIHSDKAPAAIGPYSQACVYQNLIFCSGQIALGPNGESFLDKDVSEQCRKALENLQYVLQAAGSDFSHVLKVNIFLLDMADFAAVNEVHSQFFSENPPARACVAVSGLPRGARIELECTAVRFPKS